ncbi:MAG: PBP1A family penicillin-binding protein [Pseudomonadota bacterium]
MKWIKHLLGYLLGLLFTGALLVAVAVAAFYFHLEAQLPDTATLRDVRFQVPLRVYSADGLLIAEYGEQRREPVAYEQVPQLLVRAFLAAEDDRFFEHPGVDYRGLLRAAVELARTGERRQGGSTITMQVARNFFLTPEKTYIRKIKEILLAMQIERELSKEEILMLYLNKIYLGHRAYGAAAAARVYYRKELDELSVAEAAMMAGLPKAPSRFNPIANPERAVVRRDYILGRMRDLGYIDEEAYAEAQGAAITAQRYRPDIQLQAGYVAEMVRSYMVDRHGAEEAYSGGYHVHTTIDSRLHLAAVDGLRLTMESYDERHGFRGPEARGVSVQSPAEKALEGYERVGSTLPALVSAAAGKSASVVLPDGGLAELGWDALKWAAPYVNENATGRRPDEASDILRVGDVVRVKQVEDDEGVKRWRLSQVPAVQGALVAMKPGDGAILALTGGYDYFHSKFNRAVQARRQPGSGFKPFIYSAALDAGYTPATLVNDSPVVIRDPSLPDGYWRPANYGLKFHGPTPLRKGLAHSRNLISIRVLRSITPRRVVDYIDRFGFEPGRFSPNLSLALGTGEVSPLEMARAYAVFANGGFLVEPYFVARIEQEGQGTVYQAEPPVACEACEPAGGRAPGGRAVAPRTVTAENRFLMYSMMRDVVAYGTARKAKSLERTDLAGKTGTTNDFRDGWFNGYNQSIAAIAWVGFDDFSSLGKKETGGRVALPGWIRFMETALEDVPEELPEEPPGIIARELERAGKSYTEYFDTTVQAVFDSGVETAAEELLAPEDDLF